VGKAPERPISKRERVTQSRVYRALLRRLTPDLVGLPSPSPVSERQFANMHIPGEVFAYFSDPIDRVYQLEQWLPVFERLNARRRVVVVTRNLGTFRYLADVTPLPLLFVRRISDLEDLLEGTDPKVCLYVNNAAANFHLLAWRRALHVHLNHGESDKVSMASNQAKAYDAVFVAGEAAEIRYKKNLLDFGGSNLVRVGRPQLDVELPSRLPASKRRTVLYAPTWEGETESMNYTSVPKYGPRLVGDLLAHGGFRIVYKPHPRVEAGSPPVAAAHQRIVKALTAANADLPREDRHRVELERSIFDFFASADAMITDVSSVAVDWLYLRTDAPMWICDPREDRAALEESSPLAARTYVLDGAALRGLAASVEETIRDDPRRAERDEARRFYFGDLAPGESTQRFLDAVEDLMARRDALLEARDAGGDRGEVPVPAT
jgi:hypothetical protein